MEAQVNAAFRPAGKWSPPPEASETRQKHSCDAASAQHRAGRRNRQAGQLRRAHLDQPDQVQIRRRALSGQREARNDLGRALLQGFCQPAGQARSRAGAGARAFRGPGDPRRGGGRRALRHHRHLGLQRIAGRGQPETRRRASTSYSRNRHGGHRPELSRQSQRRREIVHQHRRPHRHDGSRSRGDRRSIRRHRDGDPAGAGRSRGRRRLHGDHRKRGRPRDAGPDGLFRRRPLYPRHRGLSRRRA